jgi:hypothetical protein
MGATTQFYTGWDQSDPTEVAEHELLHAIGFTVNYSLFNAHVFPRLGDPDGDRNYMQNTDGTGTTLGILTAATNGTHLDPNWTTAPPQSYNQANDIMQPTEVDGLRAGQQDKAILNNAFNWTGLGGISISASFAGGATFAPADWTAITNAITDVQALFSTAGVTPTKDFNWAVVNMASYAPEPSGGTLAVLGLGMSAGWRFLSKRRARAEY